MKKSLLITILCALTAIYTDAGPVTREQAARKALTFLTARGMKAETGMTLALQGTQRSGPHGAPAKDPFFYVFNNGVGNGFVIISGDDSTEEVLGYADQGTFDTDNMPDNLRTWLDTYAEQIAWARDNGAKTIAQASDGDTYVARQVVTPLVKSHWSQNAPYNSQCPLYGSGGTTGKACPTGCLAAALSQVMNYHRWPQGPTAPIPSYKSNSTIGVLGALPAVTFDWDHINDTYTSMGVESQAEIDAVAQLLRYTGQALQTGYAPSGSSAMTTNIPSVLFSYFGYQNKANLIMRKNYGAGEWEDIIHHELRNARPVIYSADTSTGSGHAFICDGYDGHGFYHINWGWGSQADGYYRLQTLNPTSQGNSGKSSYGGYTIAQEAIIGINPTVVNDYDESEPAAGVEVLTFALYSGEESCQVNYSKTTGLAAKTLNYEYHRIDVTASFDVGLGLFNNDELVDVKKTTTVSANNFWNGHSWSVQNLGKNLSNGTYSLKLVCCPQGTGKWVPCKSSRNCYIQVEINGTKATLTPITLTQEGNLKVTSVEQRFERGVEPMQIRAYLHNNSEKDCNSSVCILIDGTKAEQEGVFLAAGSDDYVDFFVESTAGKHSIIISEHEDGKPALYTNKSFTLADQSTTPTLELVSTDVRNVENDNQYGRLMEIYLTLRNNTTTDYNSQITKSMYSKKTTTGASYTGNSQKINVSIPAGATVTIPFTHVLAIDDIYWVILQDVNKTYYNKYGINVKPAFVTWTADGRRTAKAVTKKISVPKTAVAASFEDIGSLTGTTITPNSNANTLYYIAHGATIPSALRGKNVVSGYEATTITLSEGSDFYVPQSFTTSEISYTRTPTIGADGKNGWQTIILPFKVQKVTSAGKEVDWFRYPKETGKNFWLRELTSVSGNVVNFANVATWMPNTPYIIAVPGNKWGKEYDLTGKELTFSATDVLVVETSACEVASDVLSFTGTTGKKTMANAYVLNAQGNSFVLKESATPLSTECYFVRNVISDFAPSNLLIGFDTPTDICLPSTPVEEGTADVYNPYGVKVGRVNIHNGQADLSHLPKGIYIIQGKKTVK